MSLRQVQHYLGHAHLNTTAIYLHLTEVSETKTQVALGNLYRQVIGEPGSQRSRVNESRVRPSRSR